jgi:hypothetical protein
MTKEENKEFIYNATIKLVKTTGQGVSKYMLTEEGRKASDELVEEGKLKYVKTNTDVWVCLTEGYCVEDHMDSDDPFALTHIRYHLGIKELFGLLFSDKDHRKEFEANEEAVQRYKEWVIKYQYELDELKNLEYNKELVD